MLRANVEFEAKRIKYAFGGDKRDDILAEIEKCNARLQDVLASNDRVSAIHKANNVSASRAVNSRALTFWRHAANIFHLLDSIWHCSCRSDAHLWLQETPSKEVGMKMRLNMCRGGQSVHIRLLDVPPTLVLGKPKSDRSSTASTVSVQTRSCFSLNS